MEQQLETIKSWLGTGSINIFGLPMSGKDTVGLNLAEKLNAKFLSSGLIIRAIESEEHMHYTETGKLFPTDMFRDRILPYIAHSDLRDFPLVLSSVGRWAGEEIPTIETCKNSGHEIKAAILLNVSESDVINRWETAKELDDRGDRLDDRKLEVFKTRIEEFKTKTMPVIEHYRELGLLITINADDTRENVFNNVVTALANRALASQ